MPLVSAVIVNWNGAKHLDICLPSLLSQSHRPVEIIVVDNASNDSSAEIAARHGVRWVPLTRNIGLAPALNRGARLATGDFLLFLNNDMRFHERFVESLAAEILRDPDTFSVDALQYNWEGTKQVHLATRLERNRGAGGDGYAPVPGLYILQADTSSPLAIVSACAASMLVRRSMFMALGGFDERLPFGCEDLEICLRAWLRGWRSVFVPTAMCWHKVGGSSRSREASILGLRGVLGGRMLIATKLLPIRFVLLSWLASLGGLALDAARMRARRVRARTRVFREHARNLRSVWHERRALFRNAGTTPNALLAQMLKVRDAPVPK